MAMSQHQLTWGINTMGQTKNQIRLLAIVMLFSMTLGLNSISFASHSQASIIPRQQAAAYLVNKAVGYFLTARWDLAGGFLVLGMSIALTTPPIAIEKGFAAKSKSERLTIARNQGFLPPDVELQHHDVANKNDPNSCSTDLSFSVTNSGTITSFGDFPAYDFVYVYPLGSYPSAAQFLGDAAQNLVSDILNLITVPELGLEFANVNEFINLGGLDLPDIGVINDMTSFLTDFIAANIQLEVDYNNKFAGWNADILDLPADRTQQISSNLVRFFDGPIDFKVTAQTTDALSDILGESQLAYRQDLFIHEYFKPEFGPPIGTATDPNDSNQQVDIVAHFTYEALEPGQSNLSYTPPSSVVGGLNVTDNCDPAPAIKLHIPTILPIGDHVFPITATDRAGNSNSSFIKVSVVDTLPPDVKEPVDIGLTAAAGATSIGFTDTIDPDGTPNTGDEYLTGCTEKNCETFAGNSGVRLYPPQIFDFGATNAYFDCSLTSSLGTNIPCLDNGTPAQLPVGETSTITWIAKDNQNPPNTRTITQQVAVRALGQNTAPVAQSLTTTIAANQPTDISLTATDAEFDSLEYSAQSLPGNGQLAAEFLPTYQTRFKVDGTLGYPEDALVMFPGGDIGNPQFIIADSGLKEIRFGQYRWPLTNVRVDYDEKSANGWDEENVSITPHSISYFKDQVFESDVTAPDNSNFVMRKGRVFIADWNSKRIYKFTARVYGSNGNYTYFNCAPGSRADGSGDCVLTLVADLNNTTLGKTLLNPRDLHVQNPSNNVYEFNITADDPNVPLTGGIHHLRFQWDTSALKFVQNTSCAPNFINFGFRPGAFSGSDHNFSGTWDELWATAFYTRDIDTGDIINLDMPLNGWCSASSSSNPSFSIYHYANTPAGDFFDVVELYRRPVNSFNFMIFDRSSQQAWRYYSWAGYEYDTLGLHNIALGDAPNQISLIDNASVDIRALKDTGNGKFWVLDDQFLKRYSLAGNGQLEASGDLGDFFSADLELAPNGDLFLAYYESNTTSSDFVDIIRMPKPADTDNQLGDNLAAASNPRRLARGKPWALTFNPGADANSTADDRLWVLDYEGLKSYPADLSADAQLELCYSGIAGGCAGAPGALGKDGLVSQGGLRDMTADRDGNLYVTDLVNHRVHKWSTNGNYIGWLGRCDSGTNCDSTKGRSQGFSCTDSSCTVSQAAGNSEGQFRFDASIKLGDNQAPMYGRISYDSFTNRLYVSDYPDLGGAQPTPRIQMFTTTGDYLRYAVPDGEPGALLSFLEAGDFTGVADMTPGRDPVTGQTIFYVAEGEPLRRIHLFNVSGFQNKQAITYEPNSGYTGPDSFSFQVWDGFTNGYSNTAQVNLSIINDTTAPSISCPSDITIEGSTQGGVAADDDPLDGDPVDRDLQAMFNAVTATDNVDLPAPVISDDIGNHDNFIFPLGDTIVTFTATDAVGLSSSCTVKVTVQDTIAPELSAPAQVTLEAVDAQGIDWTPIPPQVSEAVGPVNLNNNAPAHFPLGETVLTWTATDQAGNQVSLQQNILVQDTTPPVFTNLPNPLGTTDAINGWGTPTSYALPTATDSVGMEDIYCSPASGETLPRGAFPVTCLALDMQGNRSIQISQYIVNTPDADNDGMVDIIDEIPATISNGFSDMPLGGLTAGIITPQDGPTFYNFIVNDSTEESRGVYIEVPGLSASIDTPSSTNIFPAPPTPQTGKSISACNNKLLVDNFADAGYSPAGLTVSCEPKRVDSHTINARATFVLPDTDTVIVSLNAGQAVQVTGYGITADQGNSQDLGILHAGNIYTLPPGHTLYLITNAIDDDNDNLPDAWEQYFFGGTGQNGFDDFDGDGLSNYEEYIAGTDPTSADQDQDGVVDGVDSDPFIPAGSQCTQINGKVSIVDRYYFNENLSCSADMSLSAAPAVTVGDQSQIIYDAPQVWLFKGFQVQPGGMLRVQPSIP